MLTNIQFIDVTRNNSMSIFKKSKLLFNNGVQKKQNGNHPILMDD